MATRCPNCWRLIQKQKIRSSLNKKIKSRRTSRISNEVSGAAQRWDKCEVQEKAPKRFANINLRSNSKNVSSRSRIPERRCQVFQSSSSFGWQTCQRGAEQSWETAKFKNQGNWYQESVQKSQINNWRYASQQYGDSERVDSGGLCKENRKYWYHPWASKDCYERRVGSLLQNVQKNSSVGKRETLSCFETTVCPCNVAIARERHSDSEYWWKLAERNQFCSEDMVSTSKSSHSSNQANQLQNRFDSCSGHRRLHILFFDSSKHWSKRNAGISSISGRATRPLSAELARWNSFTFGWSQISHRLQSQRIFEKVGFTGYMVCSL